MQLQSDVLQISNLRSSHLFSAESVNLVLESHDAVKLESSLRSEEVYIGHQEEKMAHALERSFMSYHELLRFTARHRYPYGNGKRNLLPLQPVPTSTKLTAECLGIHIAGITWIITNPVNFIGESLDYSITLSSDSVSY